MGTHCLPLTTLNSIIEEDNIKDNVAFISNTTPEGGEKLYRTNYYIDEYSFGDCYTVSIKLDNLLVYFNSDLLNKIF